MKKELAILLLAVSAILGVHCPLSQHSPVAWGRIPALIADSKPKVQPTIQWRTEAKVGGDVAPDGEPVQVDPPRDPRACTMLSVVVIPLRRCAAQNPPTGAGGHASAGGCVRRRFGRLPHELENHDSRRGAAPLPRECPGGLLAWARRGIGALARRPLGRRGVPVGGRLQFQIPDAQRWLRLWARALWRSRTHLRPAEPRCGSRRHDGRKGAAPSSWLQAVQQMARLWPPWSKITRPSGA
jgi:hypothetical protein